MTTIEKKLIAFIERNILLLSALLVTVIAFFVRRQSIWYHSQDYIYYFDMHEGNIQSSFYYLLVQLMGYGFTIPMHGIKWMAAIADFGVAFLMVLLCKDNGGVEKVKSLLLYAGCLFAPVVYIRGCVWAQVDSVAFALLLAALYLYRHERPLALVGAVLLAGLGVAVYPCAIVAVLTYFCWKGRLLLRKNIVAFGGTISVAVIWSGICGVLISRTWGWGVGSLFQWLTYHPYTGEIYAAPTEWLWQMLLLGGYGLALYSGVAAYRKKLPFIIAVIVQIIVTICYGSMLGW